MATGYRFKCLNCHKLFCPDPRNRRHQKYCSQPECRAASKAASQQRWLAKPDNVSYFKGPVHVNRVQQWRAAHPGYGQPRTSKSSALQDLSIAQHTDNNNETTKFTNHYSVPADYAHRRLTIKVHPDRLCAYYDGQLIARHVRCYDRYQDIEQSDHAKVLLNQRQHAREQRLVMNFLALSSMAPAFYEGLQHKQPNTRHHLRRILALAEIYPSTEMDRAIQDGLAFHAFSADYFRGKFFGFVHGYILADFSLLISRSDSSTVTPAKVPDWLWQEILTASRTAAASSAICPSQSTWSRALAVSNFPTRVLSCLSLPSSYTTAGKGSASGRVSRNIQRVPEQRAIR